MEPQLKKEIQAAFDNYEREVTISNFKVACILGMLLMPAGAVLDHFVYHDKWADFIELRLLCSSFIGLFLAFMLTRLGKKMYRACGVILLMLPTFFISLMIYETEGPESPYYAGLNLVVLMLGFVLHWTFYESLVAVLLVMGMYLAACVGNGMKHGGVALTGIFFNNLYFLVLTGIIVVTGSYFLSILRFREFAGRFELDRSKQQLEESNRKLTELDQLKSRFFANISHELRTPLTLMLSPLDHLQHRTDTGFDERTRVLLQTMQVNGMRLLKLINDLLELVRLDSGTIPVRREPLNLAEFIRGLANAARHTAEERKLALVTATDLPEERVLVDRDKLEKILLNLQFNALKFTPPGGRVEIQAAREGEEVVIRVKDTGVGIAEKDMPKVFSRFWQADGSARRKFQGVGIGLALVKELTEVQNGTVSVQSQEGKGTTFTVRLPYLPATAQMEPTPVEELPPALPVVTAGDAAADPSWLANLYRRAELLPALSQPPMPAEAGTAKPHHATVLIAEDEPDMRRFLKFQFEQHYRVLEAADGQQAIDEASRSLPDLILLDMMMPEKDGLQVCRELRAQIPTRNIPIILITARVDEETKLSVLSAGASDFLPKPFSTTELHVRVKNLVASFQYEKQLAQKNQELEHAIVQIKETEAQLVQSEKLASLGRMSAGIIHEINNPLNYAKTGLYSLRQQLEELPPEKRLRLADVLNEVEDGVNRVKNIVLDLGPFARERAIIYDSTPVAPLVEAALRFLSHEWKDVRIQKAIPPDLEAWANQVRVIQVLVNLLQNSLDALKRKESGAEPPGIWITGWAAEGRCFVSVRDNGPGIPAELTAKIFEPFFTTKDGTGIGLGLNICYRIMKDHGGRIGVRSEPGAFCEFTLDFPVQAPPVSAD